MWILTLTLLFATEKPNAPLYEHGMGAGPGFVPTLTVREDGTWRGGGAEGALSERERLQLLDAITRTKFELAPPPGVPCPGRPHQETVVTRAGRLTFGRGCVQLADPSVYALIDFVDSLTTRRPPALLLRLKRERVGSGVAEEAIVKRDGLWSTHEGRGQLDKDTLAALIAALDAALLEAPPTPEAPVCRGDYPHHLEVPGRGEVRWIWPCSKPSPSLQVALSKLFSAVGMRAP
ncbi:MAG TPA: hypothetical protein PK095_06195 [Myxococcota bacterium]|nr:hypothetical protein [Myxococcota bacterium]